MFRLNDLPFELREMIISKVVSDMASMLYEPTEEAPKGLRALFEFITDEAKEGQLLSLAPVACLGLQWQKAVEKITFRSLKLRHDARGHPTDLEDLARYVARGSPRCRYVEWIGFASAERYLLRGSLQQLFDITASWHNPELKTRPVTLSIRYLYKKDPSVSWPFSFPNPGNDDRLYQLQLEGSDNIGKFAIQPHITSLRYSGVPTLSYLRLASQMPGLRSLHIELHVDQIFRSDALPDGDVQAKTKAFYKLLNSVAPNLEALDLSLPCLHLLLDDESSEPWKDIQAFFNVTLGYAKKLCRLHISMLVLGTPPIFSLWRDQPNGQANEGRVWPRLTDFSVLINMEDEHYLGPEANSLFKDSCRAMACMPNIRQFCVAVQDLQVVENFHVMCSCPVRDRGPVLDEWPVFDGWPVHDEGHLQVLDEPKRGFRGFSTTTYGHGKNTMPRARLDFLDSSPFSAKQWPSTKALDTWKESVVGLQLVPDDVTALEALPGWKSEESEDESSQNGDDDWSEDDSSSSSIDSFFPIVAS